jgi:serine phosphatase RsbU (regulator of sigma subunit)
MSKESLRILIVDGNPEDRNHYRSLLRGEAVKASGLVFHEADSGQTGKQFCRSKKPHCILLDYRLPDLDGLQFLTEIRADSKPYGHPAVVFITSRGAEGVAAEALRRGADDFLVKEQMTADDLNAALRRALAAVKRLERGAQTTRKLKETKAQLQAAGAIQKRLFPDTAPRITGFEIAGQCHPAEATGGDFFDYLPFCDGSFGLAVGDVSGHGFEPAILAADTRAYLRAFARMQNSPGEILALTNHLLCQDTKGERFVTLFLASIHPQSRLMRFAAAGHRAYLFNRKGCLTTVESPQPPLGWDTTYVGNRENSLVLEPGAVLFLMTDGVAEAVSDRNQARDSSTMFGADRALDIVRNHLHCAAKAIVKELLDQVREFSHRRLQEDDMTAVVVKVVE